MELPAEDCSGKDQGKIGLLTKSTYGTRDASSNWKRDWQGHLENWGHVLGCSARSLFHNKKKVSHTETTSWWIEGESVGAQEAAGERVSNQSEHHRGRFGKEHQGVEPQNMLGRDWDIVPT